MKKKGNINVQTENIFPIIKQFLYSDHEIFLRELISNAVDATQKMKTLKTIGEVDTDIKNLRVEVILSKDAKTITIRDNGIGMTDKELDKYINQIAFSGAEEFVNKYKDADTKNSIIGHLDLVSTLLLWLLKKLRLSQRVKIQIANPLSGFVMDLQVLLWKRQQRRLKELMLFYI